MKMPKVTCATCERPIAAGPVAGHLSKGRVWRHDPPLDRRAPGDRLVSCAGSLEIIDLPYGQMELPDEPDVPAAAPAPEEEALFMI